MWTTQSGVKQTQRYASILEVLARAFLVGKVARATLLGKPHLMISSSLQMVASVLSGTPTEFIGSTPAGLDTFIDHLESGVSIILADMGAGSGQVASDWFDAMYEDVAATGARFTAVGVITPDPASVESVLAWANRLQDRVQYAVVQNATSPQSNFSYWDSAEQAIRFRDSLSPNVVRMEFRLAELENPARQHGVRLGQVATRQNSVDELKRASIVMRAESYRRRLFSEFDRAKEMFLP
jgi:hypothetical protein